jgi:hypothetical protein
VRVAFAGGGGCHHCGGDSVARRFDVIMLPESRCDTEGATVPFGRCTPQGGVRASVFPTGQAAAPGLPAARY